MSARQKISDDTRLLHLALRAVRTAAEDAELRALHLRLGDGLVHRVARINQVEALVGHALKQVVRDLDPSWHALLDQNRDRVTRLIAALAQVSRRLDAAGIVSAAIEAGGVMLATELAPEAYCPGDIDLLVAPGRDDEIAAIMQKLGFEPGERPGRVRTSRREWLRREAGHELRLDLGSVVFERKYLPLGFTVPAAEWLARRVPSKTNKDIHVLEPTDLLMQVALHTSMHHYVMPPGLRLLVDVDRSARAHGLNWDMLLNDLRSIRATIRAFVAMSISSVKLETPLPATMMEKLAPKKSTQTMFDIVLSSPAKTGLPTIVSGTFVDCLSDDAGPGHWFLSLALSHVQGLLQIPPRRP